MMESLSQHYLQLQSHGWPDYLYSDKEAVEEEENDIERVETYQHGVSKQKA